MMVLTKLLLAHFIGDFLLQPNSWVKEKEKLKMGSIRFYLHILIHGVLVFLLLWNLTPWLLAIFIMVSHGTVDFIKLYAQKEDNKSSWFLIDQLLHIVTIVLVWFLVFKPQLNFAGWYENSTFWVYAAAILFITIVSGILMREVMSKWSKSLNGCFIRFSLWRFKGIKRQEANRVYSNRNIAEFWGSCSGGATGALCCIIHEYTMSITGKGFRYSWR